MTPVSPELEHSSLSGSGQPQADHLGSLSVTQAKVSQSGILAQALMQTLPHLQRLGGGIIVIKYGGSLMTDTRFEDSLLSDIAWLRAAGVRPVVVHGGGPAINDALQRFDRKPHFVQGLRVTDEETLEIAEMVLSGRINKTIVGRLQAFGSAAIGLSGRDGRLVVAEKKQQDGLDLGRVGTVKRVDAAFLRNLLEQPQGLIPVLSPVCADEGGGALNVNADEVALAVAQALQAKQLLFMTDVPGVLADVADPGSRIPELSLNDAEAAIGDGRITGGMVPKIRSAVESIRRGVGAVRILDGRTPHALLSELLLEAGYGTRIRDGL